jgi:hypothetical protein
LQSLRKCPQGGEFFLVSLPTLQTVLLIMQHLLELSKPLPHLRVLFLAPYEGLKQSRNLYFQSLKFCCIHEATLQRYPCRDWTVQIEAAVC